MLICSSFQPLALTVLGSGWMERALTKTMIGGIGRIQLTQGDLASCSADSEEKQETGWILTALSVPKESVKSQTPVELRMSTILAF